jgi:hypothetical protein
MKLLSLPPAFMLVSSLAYSSTLTMEVIRSPETSAFSELHSGNPKDCTLHIKSDLSSV